MNYIIWWASTAGSSHKTHGTWLMMISLTENMLSGGMSRDHAAHERLAEARFYHPIQHSWLLTMPWKIFWHPCVIKWFVVCICDLLKPLFFNFNHHFFWICRFTITMEHSGKFTGCHWSEPGARTFFDIFRFFLHKNWTFPPFSLKIAPFDRPCDGDLENIFFRFYFPNPDF